MSRPQTGAEIRESFLAFFEERGHERLPSDSLVPAQDPTLLFTGAGMNQFKDDFLGRGTSGRKRATTVQKCLRVPDLENVGRTPRHHTFFEMLGNFSFGDYFKKEVIPWEWEFFTRVLGFDGERMVATVYLDDDEAYAIWRDQVGLPEDRIYRFGEKENFWPAEAPSKGPNGPCGPCSELYFDQDPGADLPSREGLPSLPGRFLEVGNFVFTQYSRGEGGRLDPLPQRNIDVGLGLERIAAVAQEVPNNFETDLFAPLLDAIQSVSGRRYGADSADDVRMRRIADHARAVFFCIADGAAPGRDGRGYVVRKILRRAVRDGIELGLSQPFLAELLPAVAVTHAPVYPELEEQRGTVQSLVQAEEERFREVYRRGIARLEAMLQDLEHQRGATIFPGSYAFELHDTYGFPLDTSTVIVEERGLQMDRAGFDKAMEEQRRRARAGSGIHAEVFTESLLGRLQGAGHPETVFEGYHRDRCAARILAILEDGLLVEDLEAGGEGEVLLDRTPFYGEGGGQVGDRGDLLAPDGTPLFSVTTTRREGGFFLHVGRAESPFRVGSEVQAVLDVGARRATERHHSATHLLQAALRRVLGEHVRQAGSLVAPDRLRFDYTQPEAPSQEQIEEVERLVNEVVLRGEAVGTRTSSLEAAKAEGVTALFGEKYGEEVRVVEVPGFSKELCGGTHVPNTSVIGPFRILGDRSLAAGIRRIEAVAGFPALDLGRQERGLLRELARSLKVPVQRLPERISALQEQLREARRSKRRTTPDPSELAQALAASATPLPDGGSFAWRSLPDCDSLALRGLGDRLRQTEGIPSVCLLVGEEGEKVPFLFLAQDSGRVPAGALAKRFGSLLGGGGGGRPDFAQGQGRDPAAVSSAVARLLESLLAPA